jgi:phosphatidylglycerophosphatase A
MDAGDDVDVDVDEEDAIADSKRLLADEFIGLVLVMFCTRLATLILTKMKLKQSTLRTLAMPIIGFFF